MTQISTPYLIRSGADAAREGKTLDEGWLDLCVSVTPDKAEVQRLKTTHDFVYYQNSYEKTLRKMAEVEAYKRAAEQAELDRVALLSLSQLERSMSTALVRLKSMLVNGWITDASDRARWKAVFETTCEINKLMEG